MVVRSFETRTPTLTPDLDASITRFSSIVLMSLAGGFGGGVGAWNAGRGRVAVGACPQNSGALADGGGIVLASGAMIFISAACSLRRSGRIGYAAPVAGRMVPANGPSGA